MVNNLGNDGELAFALALVDKDDTSDLDVALEGLLSRHVDCESVGAAGQYMRGR